MREPIRDIERLNHILDFIDSLLEFRTKHTLEELLSDKVIFYGVVKEVEMIGEAAYQLSNDFRESHPEVPWRVIINMRHVLVHGYYQISPEKLWGTVIHDIDALRPHIERYIKELEVD